MKEASRFKIHKKADADERGAVEEVCPASEAVVAFAYAEQGESHTEAEAVSCSPLPEGTIAIAIESFEGSASGLSVGQTQMARTHVDRPNRFGLQKLSSDERTATTRPEGRSSRGPGARKRVVDAMRAFVRQYTNCGEAHTGPTDTIRFRTDFHLIHIEAIADMIERCGQTGTVGCGSYWCSRCRNRFGDRLLEDTIAQLRRRYGQ